MNQTPRSGEKDLPAQAVEDSIADPNGLGPVRLTTMVVTTCVGAGIFSLAGDLAPGGANTAAVLISWAICFVGVLVMCLALAPGLLAYAVMSFARGSRILPTWQDKLCALLLIAGTLAAVVPGATGAMAPV